MHLVSVVFASIKHDPLEGVLRTAALLALALATAYGAAPASAAITEVADTSSPRATLRSFLDACNEIGEIIKSNRYLNRETDNAAISRVIDCLDTSKLPEYAQRDRAGEVAAALKEILDRVELPPWDEVPDLKMIEEAGGFEQLSRWRAPGTRITISRVEEGPDKHEYLFSTGTVERAVPYYKSVKAAPYRTGGPPTTPGLYEWYLSAPGNPLVAKLVRSLPESMRLRRTLGLTNWKWIGLLILLALAALLMIALYRMQIWLAPLARRHGSFAYALTALLPVLAALAPLLAKTLAHDYLTVRGTPLYLLGISTTIVVVFAAIVASFVVCNRLAELIIATPSINSQGLDAQLIRIGFKLLSLSLAVVIFLIGGQYLGVPVGTLLASAGIGGIALALGAQDTLKTLFGTIMLLADKPFRVGERIVFRNYDGVVEDIGLRSTRLRLLNGHQVTIPNNELASMDIENVGRRLHIRRVVHLRLPLTSTAKQLRTALKIVNQQLENHEGMVEEYPPRVRLLDFSEDAYVIRAIYWYHPAEYWDYLAFSEKFNLAVLEALEEQGIALAAPLRVTSTDLENRPAPFQARVAE